MVLRFNYTLYRSSKFNEQLLRLWHLLQEPSLAIAGDPQHIIDNNGRLFGSIGCIIVYRASVGRAINLVI